MKRLAIDLDKALTTGDTKNYAKVSPNTNARRG